MIDDAPEPFMPRMLSSVHKPFTSYSLFMGALAAVTSSVYWMSQLRSQRLTSPASASISAFRGKSRNSRGGDWRSFKNTAILGTSASLLASAAAWLAWDFMETVLTVAVWEHHQDAMSTAAAAAAAAGERDLYAAPAVNPGVMVGPAAGPGRPRPDYRPDMDVKLPMPDVTQLNLPDFKPSRMRSATRYADPEYFMLSCAVFVLMLIFAAWYFWPERPPARGPEPHRIPRKK